MKSLISAVPFLLTIVTVRAQTDTLPFFTVTRGIYTSYTSLRNGVPNRVDSFRIVTRTKGDIIMVGGGPYAFELVSADKSQWRELRKALVGISDGRQFYISDKYTCGGWMGISKCYLDGPYIVSLTRGSAAQYTSGKICRLVNRSTDCHHLSLYRSSSISKLPAA